MESSFSMAHKREFSQLTNACTNILASNQPEEETKQMERHNTNQQQQDSLNIDDTDNITPIQ